MGFIKSFTVICVALLSFANFSCELNCDIDGTGDCSKTNKTIEYFNKYDADEFESKITPFGDTKSLAQCTDEGIYADHKSFSNYYVCLSDKEGGYKKYDFSCGPNKYFVEISSQCLDFPEWSTVLPTTSEVVTVSTPATTLSPTTSTTEASNTCTSSGVFPFPSNCKFYYKCSKKFKCVFFRCHTFFKTSTFVCPDNSYFNENLKKCSYEISPVCLAQILGQTFRAAPMTAAFKFIKPLNCFKGDKLPFPGDCTKYFHCTDKGAALLTSCPRGLYFDETSKSCLLTMSPNCELLKKKIKDIKK